MPNYLLSEETLSNIQPKPPVTQLQVISLGPVTDHQKVSKECLSSSAADHLLSSKPSFGHSLIAFYLFYIVVPKPAHSTQGQATPAQSKSEQSSPLPGW